MHIESDKLSRKIQRDMAKIQGTIEASASIELTESDPQIV